MLTHRTGNMTPRDDQINLRLTAVELADIRLRAKAAGLSASEYIRRAAAGCMACDDAGVTCANPAAWEGVVWSGADRFMVRLCKWHADGY